VHAITVLGDSEVNIGKLSWKKVITKDGFALGEAQGGEVNTSDWQVTHLHVGLSDETLKKFGLRKPFLGQVLICLPVNYIEKVADSITLNKSFEELKGIKECHEFHTE
jgi:sporulation protein YlmC with PRC-barrel domain